MIKSKQSILQAIEEQGMLPLFYADDERISIEVVRTLYKAGVRVVEYTNRGGSALWNFKLMKETFAREAPDLLLGIGTIKSAQEALEFISVGADFIVSPIVNAEVATICNQRHIFWIPGCMTPTEIYEAQQLQALLIKIFPANVLGPEFIKSIKELFAGQRFMPTGGVTLERANIETWFKAGVCAVGMGSKLVDGEVLTNGLYELLYKRTVEVLSTVKQISR